MHEDLAVAVLAPPSATMELDETPALVISSVAVRSLGTAFDGTPFTIELIVRGQSIIAGSFTPDATEGGSHTVRLSPARFVFPFSPDPAAPLPNRADGVHVVLRKAGDEDVLLGTAMCHRPEEWFPLTPCRGEVRVGYRVRRHRAAGPPHLEVNTNYTNGLMGLAPIRHAVSAGTTPTQLSTAHCRKTPQRGGARCEKGWCDEVVRPGSSACKASHAQHPQHEDHSHPNLHGPMHPTHTPPNSPQPPQAQQQQRQQCVSPFSAREVHNGGVRTREGQPRNLVFSHFRVSGFLPLSPTGTWRLDLAWPHPQLAITRRSLLIPPHVDENGAAELRETISVDLPLFLRGEVQMQMSAVWSGNVGSEDARTTHLRMEVKFDPIVLDVQESETSLEVRRGSNPMLAEGLPLSAAELVVQLHAALVFHEPLREGQNGRPTSAFPQRRVKRRSEELEIKNGKLTAPHEEPGNGQQEMLNRHVAKGTDTKHAEDHDNDDGEDEEEEEDANSSDVEAEEPLPIPKTQILPAYAHPVPESNHDLQNTWPLPRPSPSVEGKKEEQQQRQLSAAPWRALETFCRPPRRVPMPPMRLVEDLVPCFNERQRRAIFDMYDLDKRGFMTREQLLHFCRAHVALFESDQTDASIVRTIWPYLANAVPRSTSGTVAGRSFSPPQETIRTQRSAESLNRPYSANSGNSIDKVAYEVFAIIALRLSSM